MLTYPCYSDAGHLIQVGEYHLHGNVQSVDKVRLGHNTRDTLLLTFRDAKVTSCLLYSKVASDEKMNLEINESRILYFYTFQNQTFGNLIYVMYKKYQRV